MKNSNTLRTLALANLAIGLLSLPPFLIPKTQAEGTPGNSNPLAASGVPIKEETSPPSLKMRTVRLFGKHKGYTVDVRYPQFTGGSRAAMRKINREIKLVVDRNISALPAPKGVSNYQYSCDFAKCLVTSRLVSLNFRFSSYLGGAGDEEAEVPLNVQIFPQFKLLKLRDLLGKKVDYSKLARLYLKELQLDSEPDGLTPVYFSNFTFDRDGLTVTLPQGEFAAVGRGCPSATIAYKQLDSFIGKKSPIREILQSTTKRRSDQLFDLKENRIDMTQRK